MSGNLSSLPDDLDTLYDNGLRLDAAGFCLSSDISQRIFAGTPAAGRPLQVDYLAIGRIPWH